MIDHRVTQFKKKKSFMALVFIAGHFSPTFLSHLSQGLGLAPREILFSTQPYNQADF